MTTPTLRTALRQLPMLTLATLLAALTLAALVAGLLALTAVAARAEGVPAAPAGPPVPTDPRHGEVPLPAAEGWTASLVLDNQRVGVWTVKSSRVFAEFGCPELVINDDRGRCQVLVSYSGTWTPRPATQEGTWLGGLTIGDVDPRFAGGEIYSGGLLGNLYQILPRPQGMLDARLIAQLPGREIHTIVGGDLDPRTPGRELLLFTRPGGLYRLTPDGPDGAWRTTFLAELPGRVRDAVILPGPVGEPPEIATVSRHGALRILRITEEGPTWTDVIRLSMGMGRIAMRTRRAATEPVILYSTCDDGRVLRHERHATGWATGTIYAGPQGPRGLAAGRFHEDPEVESVAVYGYSGKIQLLTRGEDGWGAETLFVGPQKGHWLCPADLDSRNVTDEIVACGFGGRVILLSRPAGYGRPGVPTDPDAVGEEKEPAEEPGEKPTSAAETSPAPKPEGQGGTGK